MGAEVERRIIHVDLDHFFTQVEIRDNPRLAGKPVAVGGKPPRGVIATANYEARWYGVGSALATAIALQRCPHLVLLPPRFERYKELSEQVMSILHEFTPLVEQVSVDEAYLDVTEPNAGLPRSGTIIGRLIRRELIRRLRLTASVGVSMNKFLAKTCSSKAKPRKRGESSRVMVVTPEEAPAFIESLSIEEFHGVGPRTAERLRLMGIRNGKNLRAADPIRLEERLGKNGRDLYELAHCRDERPVTPERERKSISSEDTFDEDQTDLEALEVRLRDLAERVSERLHNAEAHAAGVFIKIKYADHSIITRRKPLTGPTQEAEVLASAAVELLRERVPLEQPVRLLGVGAHELLEPDPEGAQPLLFPELLAGGE